MGFDVFTIAALADECLDILLGGRVQDIIDVDRMGLGLEIYANRQRHYLYLSADSQQPRMYLADGKLRRGLMNPTQLGLLCRRYVENGIVAHVSQPDWERLLRIDIEGPEGKVALVIELMPRRANVLLLREGLILDCLNRVGPNENRYRLSLPNHSYVPPPPIRGQLDPRALTLDDIQRMLGNVEKAAMPARRLLPGKILGLSPLLAKEIVYRAAGNVDCKAVAIDAHALYSAFQDVCAPLLRREWRPGIGIVDGLPSEFAAFSLSFLDWRDCDSISAAICQYFGSSSGVDAYDAAKKSVSSAINEAKAKLRAKLASLRKGLRDEHDLETLKQSGELILAYQYGLREGQDVLRAQYDPAGPELLIRLEPKLSPVENAQSYFRKYEKAKLARAAVPKLIDETAIELEFLAQLKTDLAAASNWPEIDDVIQMMQSRGHWRGRPTKRIGGGRQGPLRVVSKDGYVLWIGRNSRQNDNLTFKKANHQDLWLHARGAPGSHVIIRNDGRRIGEDLIEKAAAVAAYYSGKRGDNRVNVDCARVKYVKAIKGAGPGMVTYRNERTLAVRPSDESIFT